MTQDIFEKFLEKTGSVPGIQIDRDSYLRKTFGKNYQKEINEIILQGPLAAGIPLKEISKLANQSIKSETVEVTAISAGTGLFGGPAMVAAVPADIIQFYAHVFRMVQKLMYLYGWDEDIFDESGNLDDATTNMLILYIGVMFGVGAAGKVLAHIAKVATKRLVREIPARFIKNIITKQAFREVIKKIIKAIGVKTAVKVTMVSGSKIVPFIGALTSGGITAMFFVPMSMRLKKYLENGELKNMDAEDDLESL